MPRAPIVVSSTRRGTERKNQVNTQATLESTGFGDRRITARMTPPLMPTTMASAVTSTVPFQRPSSTGLCCIASHTKGQLNASLVSTMLTNMATSRAITATATHRSGWRTGAASIRPGRSSVARASVSRSWLITG